MGRWCCFPRGKSARDECRYAAELVIPKDGVVSILFLHDTVFWALAVVCCCNIKN